MTDPSGVNNLENPYYLKPNHVRIAKELETKSEFLGSISVVTAPSVSGLYKVGETLTRTEGTYTGTVSTVPDQPVSPSNGRWSYHPEGASLGTASTYVQAPADYGLIVRWYEDVVDDVATRTFSDSNTTQTTDVAPSIGTIPSQAFLKDSDPHTVDASAYASGLGIVYTLTQSQAGDSVDSGTGVITIADTLRDDSVTVEVTNLDSDPEEPQDSTFSVSVTEEVAVKELNPADNSSGVAINAQLLARYDGNLAAVGSYTVYNASDVAIETFTLSTGLGDNSGTVSLVGTSDGPTSLVVMTPGADLAAGTGHYILASGIQDTKGFAISGLSVKTDWDFTVAGTASIVLSSASATATGRNTADLSITTDTTAGDQYVVVTDIAGTPTEAQMKAGQGPDSLPAQYSSSRQTPSATENYSATGLVAETFYYTWFYQENGAATSNIIGDTFTTDDALAVPSIPGAPTISGTVQEGETLTATASTPVTGNPTPTRSWQWQNNTDGPVGTDSTTYVLQASDVGDQIYVTQTETNTEGSDSENSALTVAVVAAVVPVTNVTASNQDANGDSLHEYDASATTDVTLAISTQSTAHTAAEILAGVGGAIVDQITDTWTTAGDATISFANGIASGTYYTHVLPDNGGDSDVVVSNGFTLDTVLPTVSSGATDVAGDTITLTTSKTVTGTGTPADWAVNGVVAGAPTIDSVTISGTSITIEISGNLIQTGETITVDYTKGANTIDDAVSNEMASFTGQAVTNNADTQAPSLSSPTAAKNGTDGATSLGVTTDEDNGTLYWGIYPTASTPSVPDIKAGTGATVNGSQAVSATGVQAVSDQTGLTAATAYKAHYVHTDDAANDSTASVSAEFTTDSASGLTLGANTTIFQDQVLGQPLTTLTLPSSSEGDWMIFIAVSDNAMNFDTVATASTVTLVTGQGWTTVYDETSNPNPATAVLKKKMGATPDTGFDIYPAQNSGATFIVRVIEGGDATDVVDTFASASGASGMPNPPSISAPSVDNCMIMAIGALDDDEVTPTAPSGYSDLLSITSNNGPCTNMVATKLQTTAAAEDPDAFGGSGTDSWKAVTIALKPA